MIGLESLKRLLPKNENRERAELVEKLCRESLKDAHTAINLCGDLFAELNEINCKGEDAKTQAQKRYSINTGGRSFRSPGRNIFVAESPLKRDIYNKVIIEVFMDCDGHNGTIRMEIKSLVTFFLEAGIRPDYISTTIRHLVYHEYAHVLQYQLGKLDKGSGAGRRITSPDGKFYWLDQAFYVEDQADYFTGIMFAYEESQGINTKRLDFSKIIQVRKALRSIGFNPSNLHSDDIIIDNHGETRSSKFHGTPYVRDTRFQYGYRGGANIPNLNACLEMFI